MATSHPTWMVARWVERYGAADAVQLLQANNRWVRGQAWE